jgi:cytochrome c oxidase subunit 2
MRRINHGIRIAVIWLVVTAIVIYFITILPIPSPVQSSEGAGEHQTLYLLFYVGAPIFTFVWVLFAYNVIVFRRRRTDPEEDSPAPPEPNAVLFLWAGISFAVVLFLAGWGTFTLREITEAKSSHPLVVQAIGQQWYWTFRYPSYGGMETKDLVIPVHTPIKFEITSLDVVHSLWIYDYDLKEDAVPGVDNTAWLVAKQTGSSTPDGKNWIQCNELCGLWHGYMHAQMRVISPSAFTSWARKQQSFEQSTGLLAALPKYSSTYYAGVGTALGAWPDPPQDVSP